MRRPLAPYDLLLRAIEYAAIGMFALLALFSMGRLIEVSGATLPLPLIVLVAVPCGWVAADLFSGVVHLICDRFGSVRTPIIGYAVIRGFREHHADPQSITRHGFVETNGASCFACLPALAATSIMPLDSVPLVLTQAILLFTTLGVLITNQCHKWAHLDAAALPAAVRWVQHHRLILPREHHAHHHRPPYDSHFCTASGWLNRPLDALIRRWL